MMESVGKKQVGERIGGRESWARKSVGEKVDLSGETIGRTDEFQKLAPELVLVMWVKCKRVRSSEVEKHFELALQRTDLERLREFGMEFETESVK